MCQCALLFGRNTKITQKQKKMQGALGGVCVSVMVLNFIITIQMKNNNLHYLPLHYAYNFNLRVDC